MININRLFSFYLLFLSFSLFAQDPTSCIENPDDYYFSLKNISGDNNFDISDEETKLDLKLALTNQIVSKIQVQSTVNQTFKRVNNEFLKQKFIILLLFQIPTQLFLIQHIGFVLMVNMLWYI